MTGPALISVMAVWAVGWFINARLAASHLADARIVRLLVPVIFGLTLLLIWELLVRMTGISPIVLPPPSMIAERVAGSLPIL